MCGRFALAVEVADLMELLPGLQVDAAPPARFNIAPTQETGVVANETVRTLRMVRWGLVPPWAKDISIGSRMINARAETLAEKASFRGPLRRRRCVVPASGFFEWRKADSGKEPVYVTLASGRPLAIAGLWDTWKDEAGAELRTFTLITTQANELLAPIHDRMPVILPPDAVESWLDPAERTAQELAPLLEPLPSSLLRVQAVGKLVNSPSNDTPECIRAL